MNEHTAPTKRALVHYSLIALPLSFAGLPLYIHMPDFYALQFSLDVGALGVVLLIIRLIDALQDPVIGYIADRKSDKHAALLYIGAAALTIGIAGLCFGPPHPSVTLLWFALFMALATTGFSIISILVNMMGGLWKDNDKQRARISSWREGIGLGGLLVAALLPATLQSYISAHTAFIIFFCVFAAFMTCALPLFQAFMRNFSANKQRSKTSSVPSPFQIWSILFGENRSFFALTFLSFLSASLPAVLVLFFIRDYLNAESFTGLFLSLYFISGALFMGAWGMLARKHNLYRVWLYAMLLSIVTFCGALLVSSGDVWIYGAVCILSGIALGADLALPPALIAGRITAQKKSASASQHYAMLALLPKIAMAVAAGGAFMALDFVGFKAGQDNSDAALRALLIAYAAVPCVIKFLSAALLWRLIKKEGHINEHTERSTHHGTAHIS
ncbi:MAG: MFS transporter [Alphaproteobacteria bacterium]|nr:MFS transporter [Alphaproteobacteria bacterium]HCQ71639.1 MFS transporter [Rhodospirillaceae bacterium]|tara:strand:- start:5093 stop:6424 length:1332 start_codon:yes stop_codon:yes gene_type:complete